MAAYVEHPEYAKRITSEHADAPKYRDMVNRVASIFATEQDALKDIERSFDLDTAHGVQLDAVGRWVGISRQIKTPITGVYFSWGDANNPYSTGWNFGVWKGQYDPTSGLESLDDSTYRNLIRAKIAVNQWDGTIPGIYDIWHTAFPDSRLIVQDRQDMTMTIGVAVSIVSGVYKAVLQQNYLPIKPAGVRIRDYRFVIENTPMFAWGANTNVAAGWGTGGWGEIHAGA